MPRGRANRRRWAHVLKVYAGDPEVWVRAGTAWFNLGTPVLSMQSMAMTRLKGAQAPGKEACALFKKSVPVVKHQLLNAPEGPLEVDVLIPWLARETARALKVVRRQDPLDGQRAQTALGQMYSPVAVGRVRDWYRRHYATEPIPTTWAEAQIKSDEWHATLGTEGRELGPDDQGTIKMRWPDGWTIQELDQKEQLEAEGDAMRNCVADYWEGIEEHRTRVFSLRNPFGQPHVTIEFSIPEDDYAETDWRGDEDRENPTWSFQQFEGRDQTQPPHSKYRDRLFRFVAAMKQNTDWWTWNNTEQDAAVSDAREWARYISIYGEETAPRWLNQILVQPPAWYPASAVVKPRLRAENGRLWIVGAVETYQVVAALLRNAVAIELVKHASPMVHRFLDKHIGEQ